jgi:hypothetical protein
MTDFSLPIPAQPGNDRFQYIPAVHKKIVNDWLGSFFPV